MTALAPQLGQINLWPIVQIYLVYCAYEIFFHFLLGVSLPQFFMGISPGRKFGLKNILGPIRFLIGQVTAPLLIFDLPILWEKRSLKEFLTATRLEYTSLGARFIGLLLFIPALFVATYLSPLAFLPRPFYGEDYSRELRQKTFPTYEGEAIHLSLPKYHLSLLGKWPKDLFILPYYENNQLSFDLYQGNETPESLASFWHVRPLDLKGPLQSLKNAHPLLSIQYPHLARLMSTSTWPEMLDKWQVAELSELIHQTLSLNIKNLQTFILDNPIFFPHVLFQKKLLQALGLPAGKLRWKLERLSDNEILEISMPEGLRDPQTLILLSGLLAPQIKLQSSAKGRPLFTKYYLAQLKATEHIVAVNAETVSNPNGLAIYQALLSDGPLTPEQLRPLFDGLTFSQQSIERSWQSLTPLFQ